MARWIGVAAVLALAGSALGQTALGDGTGLYRDMSEARFGPPPIRDFAAEVRFRNAIITGNAPGGMSFRGDVGYRSPLDFGGTTASDDLFTFRRDSLASGLAGVGMRGTDALQYQFAMTTGNAFERQLRGTAPVLRSPVSVSEFAPAGPSDEVDQRLGTDGLLRSSAAYAATRGLRPNVIGYRNMGRGEFERIAASSILGLQAQPWQPMGAEEAAVQPPPANPLIARPPSGPASVVPEAPEVGPSLSPTGATLADALRSRLRLAGAGIPPRGEAEAEKEPWEMTLEELKASLLRPQGEQKPTEAPEGEAPRRAATGTIDPEALKLIRGAGGTAETFASAPPVATPVRDLYGEFMKRGEQMVAAGQYFDAEEQFARALSYRPGDLAAAVGRVHAQMSASMFISASFNLRMLLRENPGIASTRYSPALIGGAERGKVVAEMLRENIAAGKASRDCALLLAYLGYQRADEAMTREGLDALDRDLAGADGQLLETQRDRVLGEFLRAVWLTP